MICREWSPLQVPKPILKSRVMIQQSDGGQLEMSRRMRDLNPLNAQNRQCIPCLCFCGTEVSAVCLLARSPHSLNIELRSPRITSPPGLTVNQLDQGCQEVVSTAYSGSQCQILHMFSKVSADITACRFRPGKHSRDMTLCEAVSWSLHTDIWS